MPMSSPIQTSRIMISRIDTVELIYDSALGGSMSPEEMDMVIREIINELRKLDEVPPDYRKFCIMCELSWSLMDVLQNRLNVSPKEIFQ